MRTLKNICLLSLILSSVAFAQGYLERLDVDNIRLDDNTISTTNTNGHLLISPNGTGLLEYTPGTASTIPYLDASKRLVSSAVTPTELGYLSGVGSGIQTQIDGKLTNPLTTNGDLLTQAAGIAARLGIGSANTVLQSSGSAPQWTSTLSGLTLSSPIVNTPTIDVMTLDGQGSAPSNPSAGFYKVYVKDATGKPVILNSSGTEQSLGGGGGSSGINMLSDNPGAESALTGWDDTGSGTFTTTSTFANVGNGAASFSYDASANNDYAANDPVNIPAGLYGQNCLAQFYYKGFDSNITVQVHDGSNVIASQALSASTDYTPFQLNFICPSTGALQLRFLAGADAAIGYWDEVHLGSALNITSATPQDVFSADVSSAGVISSENADFINGNCVVTSTSTYTCATVAGMFNARPNCRQSLNDSSLSQSHVVFDTTNSTKDSLIFKTNDASGGAAARAFGIICQKTGVDAPRQVLTTDNSDYGWTDYTPTISGVGTATNVSFKHRRVGQNIEIRGSWTNGTVAGSQARVSLPTGIVPDLAVASPGVVVGYAQQDNATAVRYATHISGNDYLTFGSSSVSFGPQNGSGAFTSSVTVNLNASLPVQGWTQSNRAPQLVNSVVNSSTGVTATEVAKLNCDAGSAITSQHGAWVSSIGNISGGACAITLTSGVFSSTPYCTAMPATSGGWSTTMLLNVDATSSTAVSVDCEIESSTACTAVDFILSCVGPK